MKYIIFFLSLVYLHIIDDFILQGVLSKLKRKVTWIKDKEYKDLYKYDYIISLIIHGLSWTISVHIPVIFLFIKYNYLYDLEYTNLFIISFLVHWYIHCITDNKKANQMKINLVQDQLVHFWQLIMIFMSFVWIIN